MCRRHRRGGPLSAVVGPVLNSAQAHVIAALVITAAALCTVPDRVRRPGGARSDKLARRAGLRGHRRTLVAGTVVTATGLLLWPDRWWLALGAGAFAAVAVGGRRAGRSERARRADRSTAAVHADLFAACLDAGMAVAPALRAVSEVMTSAGWSARAPASGPERLQRNDPVRRSDGHGDAPGSAEGAASRAPIAAAGPTAYGSAPLAVLDSVAAMLLLGADPHTAWGAADDVEELAPLAAAARRSAAGGGGLADAVREHATLLRAEDAAADLRAAGRAGVLMTAPLGVCFLPAFLCLGLAPVVVGLLGQLDIF